MKISEISSKKAKAHKWNGLYKGKSPKEKGKNQKAILSKMAKAQKKLLELVGLAHVDLPDGLG
jgi:hypothetical protein